MEVAQNVKLDITLIGVSHSKMLSMPNLHLPIMPIITTILHNSAQNATLVVQSVHQLILVHPVQLDTIGPNHQSLQSTPLQSHKIYSLLAIPILKPVVHQVNV